MLNNSSRKVYPSTLKWRTWPTLLAMVPEERYRPRDEIVEESGMSAQAVCVTLAWMERRGIVERVEAGRTRSGVRYAYRRVKGADVPEVDPPKFKKGNCPPHAKDAYRRAVAAVRYLYRNVPMERDEYGKLVDPSARFLFAILERAILDACGGLTGISQRDTWFAIRYLTGKYGYAKGLGAALGLHPDFLERVINVAVRQTWWETFSLEDEGNRGERGEDESRGTDAKVREAPRENQEEGP